MGVKIIEQAGLEADDLLGTISKRCEEMGMDVSVISGDRDLLQLATEKVKIRIPKTKQGKTEVEDYYAEDVNGRRLAIYLPCDKDLYDNTIASLMGQDTYNAAGTAGMIITRVGPLGCLTKGIVLNPICFEKGNIFTANHYDRVLKHEMAHYVFLTSLNYGNNVSHYNWVVEGIAEYFSFNREYVVTGKDSLDFMNRNCKLNGNFPIERNSAYWGGESFFSYLEKISGKNGVKQFIQNTYEMPTDSVFKKGNMNIESLHQNWIAGQNTLTETDSIH
jgi:hypothetical protein